MTVTFDVPDELTETFSYLPGQHVTVRAEINEKDIRRSYSICANANSGKLRVGIKRLPGGAFSNFATSGLKAGDTLDVMAPVGEFTIDIDPAFPRRAVAIAAGSGVTPLLSLISTSLESEPNAMWTTGPRQSHHQQHHVSRRVGRPQGSLSRALSAIAYSQPRRLGMFLCCRAGSTPTRSEPFIDVSWAGSRSMGGISAVPMTS